MLSKESSADSSRKACGLLSLMDKFSSFFSLKIAHFFFAVTEQVSLTLQGKDVSSQDALKSVAMANCFFTHHRSEESFSKLYREAVEEAKELTQPPILPRRRYVPKRIDDDTDPGHSFETPEEYFQKSYFEVIDLLDNELDNRFSQLSFRIMDSNTTSNK